MSLRIEELAVGARVFHRHDTGAFGYTPVEGTVIRVNRVTVTVRYDYWPTEPQRIRPEHLNRVSWDESDNKKIAPVTLPIPERT